MAEPDLLQLLVSNIERHMEARGLNAVTLAAAAGMNRNVVYDILKRKSSAPKITTIDAIAKAMGMELPELLMPEGDDRAKRVLSARIDMMSDEDAEKVSKLVDVILGDRQPKSD